jgi:hypothetical protein
MPRDIARKANRVGDCGAVVSWDKVSNGGSVRCRDQLIEPMQQTSIANDYVLNQTIEFQVEMWLESDKNEQASLCTSLLH